MGSRVSESRLLRPLALGKADFACARAHRSRRRVEAASETAEDSGLGGSKKQQRNRGRNTAGRSGIQASNAKFEGGEELCSRA